MSQAVFLGAFLRWSALGFLVAGSGVLLVRTVYSVEPLPLPVLLTPVVLALGLALWIARRRGMSARAACAWLDVQAGGDGLLVTGHELTDARWGAAFDQAAGRAARLPAFRVGARAGQSFGAAAFVVLALWIEIPAPTPGPSPALFTGLLEGLQDKLDTLSESVELDDGLAQELAERLGRLEEQLEDDTAESLFEAIDGLEERLGLEGERVRDAMDRAARELANMALDQLRDPGAATESLQRALSALREAGLGQDLPESLIDLLSQDLMLPEGIQLDTAQMMELGEELAALMQERMGELGQAGLFTPATLQGLADFANLSEFQPMGHTCDEECEEYG